LYFSQIEANSCGFSGKKKLEMLTQQITIPKINFNLSRSSIAIVL